VCWGFFNESLFGVLAPRNNSDGVLWLSENCALVNGLPFCRIRLGRKPPRGDLFKNMRRYLDERETDPLP